MCGGTARGARQVPAKPPHVWDCCSVTGRSTAMRRAALIAIVLLVVWLGVVRHQTGEARFWPSGTPARLHFDGRDYHRGDREPIPTGAIMRKHLLGGGEVVTLPEDGTSTVVWIRNGTTPYAYGLLGGP